MMTTVLVTFHVKEDQLNAFEALLRSVKTELPKVNGCSGVRILRHSDENAVFTLIEEWDSKITHSTHIKNLQASGDWENIEKMLRSLPETRYTSEF